MKNLVANPMIVYREEFDEWSVLFDPDTGNTYGLDPLASFIWGKLDGKHDVEQILEELSKVCEEGIPCEAGKDVDDFISNLINKGLVGLIES